jgi:hypothetical protein
MRATISLVMVLGVLSACSGVPTGQRSPCHGTFRAEGQFFQTRQTSDGTPMVVSVSTMNTPRDC